LAATAEIQESPVEGGLVDLQFGRQATIYGVTKRRRELWIGNDSVGGSFQLGVFGNDR
jgi:hypothetical protein